MNSRARALTSCSIFPGWKTSAGKQPRRETLVFARLLIQGVLENLVEVDDTIKGQLENWDFSRLEQGRSWLLRMSVYCLLHQSDIPATVTIDEAVDISKTFGTADSYRFVNGVLDGVRKKLQLQGG